VSLIAEFPFLRRTQRIRVSASPGTISRQCRAIACLRVHSAPRPPIVQATEMQRRTLSTVRLIVLLTDLEPSHFVLQGRTRPDFPPLASPVAFEATSERDNWRRALPRGTRSGVKRNLESTTGLQL
jgi:hypothetical protein